MANREPDPRQGVFRWTFVRVRSHLTSFTVTTVLIGLAAIFVGAVESPVTDPSWSQQFWNGSISLTGGIAVVLLVVTLYAVVRAPYEQRNALRKIPDDDPAAPLAVDVSRDRNLAFFSVTNLSDVELEFSITCESYGAPGRTEQAQWDSFGSKVFRKSLLPGELGHASLPILRGVRRIRAQFHWTNGRPLCVCYDLRTTLLGVDQVKEANDPWPERDASWLKRVVELQDFARKSGEEVAALAPTDDDLASARALWKSVVERCSASQLVGSSVHGGEFAVNKAVLDHSKTTGDQPCIQDWLDGYAEAFAGLTRVLTSVILAETDSPFLQEDGVP